VISYQQSYGKITKAIPESEVNRILKNSGVNLRKCNLPKTYRSVRSPEKEALNTQNMVSK